MAQSQNNLEELLESQSQLQALFVQRMDDMENVLKKASSPTPSMTTSTLAAEYFKFKDFVLTAFRSIQAQIALLSDTVDKLEMQKRRKMLLIHGVPEAKDEVTAALVTDIVISNLKIADFSDKDISHCHRMGRPSEDRPRPILVKLHTLTCRNNIWYAKTQLRRSGITLSEFLTKSRHGIFMAARHKFGITKCWTREGSVFILGSDGVRHRVNCIGDLDKIDALVAAPTIETRKLVRPANATAALSTKSRRHVVSSKK